MNDKKTTDSHLNKISRFEYPRVLKRFPRLIYLIYCFNFLLQLRKWYVFPRICNLLRSINSRGTWLDLGCGEGQYLVPIGKKFSDWDVAGVDNNASNIQFLQKLIPANTTLTLSDIETLSYQHKAILITCIGVLQYIEDDELALQKISSLLSPDGKFLLYSPVNGRLHLALYKYLLNRYEHYETVNNRKRVYRENELTDKLLRAGFTIEEKRFTYGYCGRISHEILGISLLLLTSAPIIIRCIAALLFLPVLTLALFLMLIDFSLTHTTGNGLLITAKLKT